MRVGGIIAVVFIIVLILLCIYGLLIYPIIQCIKETKEDNKKCEKYNVSKFPVTSKMGNQYYAEIVYNSGIFQGGLYCNVYDRVFKKNGKYKDEVIITHHIDFESYNYNYVNVVSETINEFEKKCEVKLLEFKHEKEEVKKNKEMFEKWDGIIQ